MKRSTMVTLVISGALLTGCDDQTSSGDSAGADWQYGNGQTLTNNTYNPSYGYYHAPYGAWYPYQYNSYHPGLGYYHGGSYSPTPHISSVTSSHPVSSFSHGSSGISRGGFGGSGHSSS